ncbi:MAG: hypothetical protein EAZ91_03255 [Cytophagales bacterium]|nr:MAG: hypothetical protein EAZ91_03255 [Cytophagales bacterium]
MKRVFTLVLGLLAFGATAQDFKPFKVNTSLGFAKPGGAGSSGGILFAVEPKYSLNDQLEVGLRMEGAIMGRAVEVNGELDGAEIKLAGSYVLTGNYFFTVSQFRPYAGVGVGLYSTGGVGGGSNSNVDLEASRKLGAMGRVGFKYGHLNVAAEYNYVPSTKYTVNLNNTTAAAAKSQNSYIGIKLGVDIGGGWYE